MVFTNSSQFSSFAGRRSARTCEEQRILCRIASHIADPVESDKLILIFFDIINFRLAAFTGISINLTCKYFKSPSSTELSIDVNSTVSTMTRIVLSEVNIYYE